MAMSRKTREQMEAGRAKVGADEPFFVLRASDKTAPAHVRAWAKQFMAHHVKAGTSGYELAKAIEKHTGALEIADAMEAWPDRKQPD